MNWTGSTPKLAVLLIFLGLVCALVNSSPIKHDFGQCKSIVRKWALSALDEGVEEDRQTLQDLLFFLHIPRTGGRTYFHCFLKKLYPGPLECPRSYDRLRFDPSKTKCRLLVTHDDFSMMSKLPRERTSVVTIFRNPIDRVFSTYEFSVEVAARFLVHPNLTSATQMAVRLRSKTNGVSTLDIWPWKYLVPWMREDLFARRYSRTHRGSDYIRSNDSYNMRDFVMPLHEYINDPIAREIIHNGATFQVAGLTNNSYLAEAHEVRHCVEKYKILGEHVLQVAKKRLDNMLYVGLTEDHRESATMFANIVGSQVISQLTESSSKVESRSHNNSVQDTSFSDSEIIDDHQSDIKDQKARESTSTENAKATKENMTVEKLMEAYETCISSLRKSQTSRRIASFKKISPANFTKEARLQVPEAVLQQIISLNNLDLELYKYAQDLFAKQHEHTTEKLIARENLEEIIYDNSYGITLWNVLPAALIVIMLISLTILYLNARRRTSKVKI